MQVVVESRQQQFCTVSHVTGFTKRSDPAVLGVEIKDKAETINFLFLRFKVCKAEMCDWRTKSIRPANLEVQMRIYCLLKVRQCIKASIIIETCMSAFFLSPVGVPLLYRK